MISCILEAGYGRAGSCTCWEESVALMKVHKSHRTVVKLETVKEVKG